MENTTTTANPATPDNQKPAEKDIGAVWVKKSQSGVQFLSLVLDLNTYGINQKVSLVGFKNKNKQKDTQPDFRIFVSNREAAKPAAPAAPVVQPTELDI